MRRDVRTRDQFVTKQFNDTPAAPAELPVQKDCCVNYSHGAQSGDSAAASVVGQI